MAFKMAGIFALKDRFQEGHPIILEPIMKVEVATPAEYQGDLVGDISRRRGKINQMKPRLTRRSSARCAAGGNVRLRHSDPFAFQGGAHHIDGALDIYSGSIQCLERHSGAIGQRSPRPGLKV